jgi:hypothetical protein
MLKETLDPNPTTFLSLATQQWVLQQKEQNLWLVGSWSASIYHDANEE